MHPAKRREAAPIQTALGSAEQEVAQLFGESSRAQSRPEALRPAVAAIGGLAAQQPAYLKQLLRARQQDRRLLTCQRVLSPDQRVRIAVERHRQRLPDRMVKPERDPLAQLGGRLAAEREHEHAAGVDRPADHPVDNRFDDGGRLPRAWSGEHEQRAARMLDDALLRIIQAWRLHGWPWQPDEAVGRRVSVHLALHSSRRYRQLMALRR